MRRRAAAILLALCMALTLLPTAAFATEEGGAAAPVEQPAQQEEKQEGQQPEETPEQPEETPQQPEEQPEAKPEPQLEAEGENTPVLLNEGSTTTVTTETELTAALAGTAETIKLTENIDISNVLTVTRAVTLDLNGHVLRLKDNPDSSVIEVRNGGTLTLTDSDPDAVHKFTPNADGLWVLNEENGTKTVTGGVITGGSTGQGGGVYVYEGGTLTMAGGAIVGCRVNGQGGGVYVDGGGTFTMNGGTIAGCAADKQDTQGGGVYVDNGREKDDDKNLPEIGFGVFTMNDGSIIDCVAINGMGGSVFVKSATRCSDYNGRFIMNGGSISDCGLPSDSKDYNTIYNIGTFIANGGTVTNSGAGKFNYALYSVGIFQTEQGEESGTEFFGAAVAGDNNGGFDGGIFNGKVLNYARITGGTFRGTVTNHNGGGVIAGGVFESGSTVINESGTLLCGAITGGTFNGTVDNNGTITGGTFNGTVNNNGAITGGTFNSTVTGTHAFATGNGTETDPYLIYSAEGLKAFRDIVNSTNPAACAKLMNDIVLNDGTFDENGNYSSGANPEEWTPIGVYRNSSDCTFYTGTFDGQGHTIKGLYVNVTATSDFYAGLFGYLEGAVIRNLTVDGYVQGVNNVGGIVGGTKANATIENCRNNCRVVCKTEKFQLHAGGIAGFAANTTITGCLNTGAVEAFASSSSMCDAAGIVSSLGANVTVKNCYNTGTVKITGNDRLEQSWAGGIVGNSGTSTVSDCYNVGTVTINYTGSGDNYIASAGGIAGTFGFWQTGTGKMRDCYNVGTVTSTGAGTKNYVGGVAGRNYGAVENCYYLDSTAAKKAIGKNEAEYGGTVDEATGSKTAAEFADGTVLALLINGRADNDHPWNSQCKYLAAAGKTLPVFKTQTGDTHTHDWSAWTHMEGTDTHSRSCTCNAVETGNCSGGEATCTEKAVCTVCGNEYGKALGHIYPDDWSSDNDNHWKECSRCGEIADKDSHVWDSGKVTTPATCTTAGVKTFTCDECGATKTERLDATGHNPAEEWKSDGTHHWHECLNGCGDKVDNAEHTGGEATCTAKAECKDCGTAYGALDPNNHPNLKHVPAKKATKTREGNIEYWHCPDCDKYFKDAEATVEITQKDTVLRKKKGGGSASTEDTTGKKDQNDKTVQSVKTGDMGIALYGATALLSLTGGAWIVGKKRRS